MSSITDLISVGVNGTGTANYLMKWLDADTATDSVIYESSGNIGIGTSSPSAPLTFASSASGNDYDANKIRLFDGNDGGATIYGFGVTGGKLNYRTGTSADQHIWWAGTTERMRIDSSGNVGIGTSSPSRKLEVVSTAAEVMTLRGQSAGGSNNTQLRFYGSQSASDLWAIGTDVATGNGGTYFSFYDLVGGAERMRIDSSGNVGIGTTPAAWRTAFPDKALDVGPHSAIYGQYGGSFYIANNWYRANNNAFTYKTTKAASFLGLEDDGTFTFNNAPSGTAGTTFSFSERMRITSGGQVGIGTTSPSATLHINNDDNGSPNNTAIFINQINTPVTNTKSIRFIWESTSEVGSISNTSTSTSYNTSSDYRLKENVVEMTGALDRVDALKPSRFNFIADPEKTVDGFLAHEVAEVVPEAISGIKDGMREEEYEVEPAVYEEVVYPAEEAVLDEEGNVIQEAKEEWTEKVLVSEAVMGTRLVPDYQGIDQSKLVPLLVGAIQELKARIELLENK